MNKTLTIIENDRRGALIRVTLNASLWHVLVGKAFKAKTGSPSLAASATKIIAFKTPATELIHFSMLIDSSGLATTEILEAPTITVDTGTPTQWKNRNRNSDNISGILSIETGPQGGYYNLDPTITDDGEILDTIYTGAGNNRQSGQSSDSNEWELKKDTVYAIRLTSGGAANVVNLALLSNETGDY